MASTEEHQLRESRRSQVRVLVTYGAALFLFLGGAAMIAVFLLLMEDTDSAKDLFLAIMPVSAGILSYWFASRNPAPDRRNDQDPNTS